MLFNADIRQKLTLEEFNLEKQKICKRNFNQKVKLKACNKIYANPGLGYYAFDQLGPDDPKWNI